MINHAHVLAENEALAIRFVKAMGENDTETFADCLAPEAEAVAMGTTKFRGARSREMMIGGVEAFKTILPDGLRFDIGKVTAGLDGAAVECKGNGVTSEGTPYPNEYCFVLEIADGKVTHVDEYFCSKMADEVLWPLVQGTGNLDSTVG